jgi:hypothetical protein
MLDDRADGLDLVDFHHKRLRGSAHRMLVGIRAQSDPGDPATVAQLDGIPGYSAQPMTPEALRKHRWNSPMVLSRTRRPERRLLVLANGALEVSLGAAPHDLLARSSRAEADWMPRTGRHRPIELNIKERLHLYYEADPRSCVVSTEFDPGRRAVGGCHGCGQGSLTSIELPADPGRRA